MPRGIALREKAVVSKRNNGPVDSVRVNGNTTSSHVKGAKNPFGMLTEFRVNTIGIQDSIKDTDFQKIDVEGLELEILSGLGSKSEVRNLNAFVEVGSKDNAKGNFDWAESLDLNIYSQKINWKKITRHRQMPNSYKQGSIQITSGESVFDSEIC